MTKRLVLAMALGVASAFALTIAAPAYACGKDCDCAKKAAAEKKGDTKPGAKPDAKPAEKPAAAEKKADNAAKCECTKGGKGCTCPKGECKCANCGHKAGFAAGVDEKKDCGCTQGKGCTCPKGECKCKKKAA